MPDDIELDQILDDALACYEAGRLDLAEAGYRTVLARDPNEPDALNLLAVILQERGDLDQSIALITRALEVVADFPEALTNLARAQRAVGAPAAAADAARRAIALDPGSREAHFQHGLALADLGDNAGAATALRHASTMQPTSADASRQIGAALLRLGDFRAAADSLLSALKLDPDRADTMTDLGSALLALGQSDEAAEWHEKAAALAPDDPDVLAALARTLHRKPDLVGSIAACRRTLQVAPDRIDIRCLLGANLAAIGRFEEAEACYRKVLSLNPGSIEAYGHLARIGRYITNAAELRRLRALLDDAATPPGDRIAAGFVAGTALDQIGDYDAAFDAFEAANRLNHTKQGQAGQGFNREALRQYADWAIAVFRADAFVATADWGDSSNLPVFIVGMPRSGMTLVKRIVACHKHVVATGERRDIADIVRTLAGGPTHRSPIEWDRDAVRHAAAAQIARLRALGGHASRVIDKSPENAQLLGQIAVLFPNARIIVCRRDPRDVCLSCYFQNGAADMPWTSGQIDLAVFAQESERLMAHWRMILPARMIEIQYEDLVADLEGQSRRLIEFLGLDWDPACLDFHSNEGPVMTASYWQVRQPLYSSSIGRWRPYRRHLRPLLAGLAGMVPSEGDEDWDALASDPATALQIAGQHHQAGRLDFAEPIYRALLRHDPDDPTALHRLGLLLLDRGEPATAITLISRSLAREPNAAPALADLARAHRVNGDADAAVEAGRRAIALDPALPEALLQLGRALLSRQDDAEAVEVLYRALAMVPQSVDARAALATALTRRNDHAAAAEAWHAALVLRPGDIGLMTKYADALGDTGRFGDALATYRQAEALAPHDRHAQFGIAKSMLHLGDIGAAVEACRHTLETAPDWSEPWLLLANCEAMLGHFAVAAEAYRRTLALDPMSANALHDLVAIGERLDDDAAQHAARDILYDQTRPIRDRIAAGFAACHQNDRNGAYDEAFEAGAFANQLLRQDRAAHQVFFDRDNLVYLMDTLMAAIGPRTFVETAGWGDPSELPVFIVGMPRSGTSLVEQIIASHPLVFGAGELRNIRPIVIALGEEAGSRAPAEWNSASVRREAMAHVQRLHEAGGDAIRVVDKMPDNIMQLGQIAVLFPGARIIVCRRDLRDVCLSCFFQYFRDDAMTWADDLADCGFRARATDRLMQHWHNVLPSPILEVQYETLVANLERESRRLIDFLGLEWDPACLSFHETERAVQTASHWQVRQPLYASSVDRWRNYQRHLGPLLHELEGLVPADSPGAPS